MFLCSFLFSMNLKLSEEKLSDIRKFDRPKVFDVNVKIQDKDKEKVKDKIAERRCKVICG